ncbi:ATP-dependent Clp protease proteolytic subunit 4, chloroplastic-like protein [Drosera capensis]
MEALTLSSTTTTLSPHPSLPLLKPFSPLPTISLKPTRSARAFRSIGSFKSSVRASEVTEGEMQHQRWAMEEWDVMGMLLRERIVFIESEIDDFEADSVVSKLLLLDSQDSRKDIRLFINSTGGSLSATMAIFDVINLVRSDVSTIALGITASTAALLLGGGTKGKRFSMPSSRIMIHQPFGGISGSVAYVERQAKELFNNKKMVVKIISAFSGRSIGQVEKDIKRDYYMSPIEGIEYGIIDGIIDRDNIIPLMPVPDSVISTQATVQPGYGKKFFVPEIPDDEIY